MDVHDPIVTNFIETVLAEDLGRGDITSQAVIPEHSVFQGVMCARQDMVVAGLPIALELIRTVAPHALVRQKASDGSMVKAGSVLAELSGPARGLLTAERSALNIVQHLSGIATLTRAYVDRIQGTGTVLLDTRKTIPGLRVFAKYATRMGGAQNHRMRLDSAVLIKDNHIAVCGGVMEAVARAKAADLSPVEVEVDTLEQVTEALEAGADRLLLDNMDAPTLRRAVAMIAGRAQSEASGGIDLGTIRGIAETGVNFISVGRITQAAPAVDIGLDWRVRA